MADKKKIALLSNITVDLVAARLRRQYDFYIPEGFDTWVQEAVNPESGLYSEQPDGIVVLLDGTESRAWKDVHEGIERIALWKQALSSMLDRITSVPVFVSTVDFRSSRIRSFTERDPSYDFFRDWYDFLVDRTALSSNLYILDLAAVAADIGRNQFYSNKMWYMSSMPYSRDGLIAVAWEISSALNAAYETRKKIIVLDLDNTLWGGVIGEDGVEGIELSNHKEGQRYYDFQRQLLEMKNRGIILAVNSKNNAEDAEAAIQGHPAMLLRDEDFVCRKINWENKAVNLKAMERELNLTEGGFIFIDDNPVERETIKGECPEVTVPEFPADTSELIGFAEEIWKEYCKPLKVLGEDRNKTQMYQNEAKRKHEMSESLNLDDYIAKLEISADIHRMRPEELERVTQLCNKTNQFNVTTKRYTKAEIEEIAENTDNAIYVAYSSDKYGDSGLISVIILKEKAGDVYIDTFLMSCRVMGRKLEDVIINEIASKYRCCLIGEFIPTAKNAPVRELYDRLGFELLSEKDGIRTYRLDAEDYIKSDFNNYKEIQFEG